MKLGEKATLDITGFVITPFMNSRTEANFPSAITPMVPGMFDRNPQSGRHFAGPYFVDARNVASPMSSILIIAYSGYPGLIPPNASLIL